MEELNIFIRELKDLESNWNLKINSNKSEILTNYHDLGRSLEINWIPIVERVKYLVMIISLNKADTIKMQETMCLNISEVKAEKQGD